MKHRSLIAFLILTVLLVGFFFSVLVSAHETDFEHEETSKPELNLPENLKKIDEYNKEQAKFYFQNLSFLVAFLAGILSILTPCSLGILPAFFAYSFKEKKKLTKMTLIFFLGFMPVFVVFGLLASFLGQTIAVLQQNINYLVRGAGFFIVVFGLMTLFGKGFSFFKFKKKTNKNASGIFLFGLLFGLGFTACLGPILVGILLIAGILQSYFYAGILMLSYSLGLFFPLFLISMFFDKYNFPDFVNKVNRKVGFSLTNLIAGLLLIGIGLIFLIYGGTFITNYLGLGDLTVFIYSIQNKLVELGYINILGVIVLAGFLFLLFKFLRRKKL